MTEIRPADWPRDVDAVRRLLREYAAGLEVDLAFQDFDGELARLPGPYHPDRGGRFLLATRAGELVGCVALRRLDGHRCEMKRLFVRPGARGGQLGQRLVRTLCEEARAAGYRQVCLDTLPSMHAAQALYRSLGFQPIAPYVFNPVPGTQYLGLDLRAGEDRVA